MNYIEGQQLVWKHPKTGKKIKIGRFTKGDKGLVLIMPRTRAKHRLRMYGGSYGINEEILNNLVENLAVVGMRVVVDEGKEVLITTPHNWKNKAIPHHTKGFEKQAHLREQDFDKWYK